MRAYRTLAVAAVVFTMVAAVGCSSSEGDDDTGGGSSTPDKVTYLTAFNSFGRESYVWVAKEKGYFADAGLDVDIKIGNGSGENMTALAGGQADFAPVDSTGYMLWIGTGKVKGITAVASVQQRSMVGLMTLEGYGVRTPRDLEGKTIGSPDTATDQILFPTYAKLAGFDAAKVKHQNLDSGQVFGALAARRVDVIGQFVVGQPLAERAAKGKKAVPLPYSDVMTDLYGHFLLTSTKNAQDNPDRTKRFAEALLKGLQYAIDNPDEAGKILNKAVPEQDPAIAAQELKIMSSYVKTASGKLGIVEEERVQRVVALLEGAGAIPGGKKAQDFVQLNLVPKA
jgi:NitT/TauT family transport system substrate-binding protein